MAIKNLLRQKRKAAGYDLDTIASRLGIGMAEYDLWENGFYKFTPEEQAALVELLDLTEAEQKEIFPNSAQGES